MMRLFGSTVIKKTATRALLTNSSARARGSRSHAHSVLVFKGDGIGPEIVDASCRVLDATGVKFDWVEMPFGYEHHKRGGEYVGETHLEAFEDIGVLFKGPLTVNPGETFYADIRGRRFTSGNQVLRKLFELYANVRPVRTVEGLPGTMFSGVDLIIVRENTEDVYTGEERWTDADTVECTKRISRRASRRVAKFAAELAVRDGRERVTVVHKANVCKQSDGLFLSECLQTAREHGKGVRVDHCLADSLLYHLVRHPQDYDVLLCPNLYGDLVSDLAGGLIGSLGLCGSANLGDKHALFEPAHGSAPDIAGRNLANPSSQILSGVMLLRHLGEVEAAGVVERALAKALVADRPVDLGGTATTDGFVQSILKHM